MPKSHISEVYALNLKYCCTNNTPGKIKSHDVKIIRIGARSIAKRFTAAGPKTDPAAQLSDTIRPEREKMEIQFGLQ